MLVPHEAYWLKYKLCQNTTSDPPTVIDSNGFSVWFESIDNATINVHGYSNYNYSSTLVPDKFNILVAMNILVYNKSANEYNHLKQAYPSTTIEYEDGVNYSDIVDQMMTATFINFELIVASGKIHPTLDANTWTKLFTLKGPELSSLVSEFNSDTRKIGIMAVFSDENSATSTKPKIHSTNITASEDGWNEASPPEGWVGGDIWYKYNPYDETPGIPANTREKTVIYESCGLTIT
jgi:hypothetical protein